MSRVDSATGVRKDSRNHPRGSRRAHLISTAACGFAPLAKSPTRPKSILLDLRVIMVTLTGFCVFLNVYATQTLLPLFQQVFGATKFKVSLTVSATTIGIALAAPLVGLLAERIGRRQTM